MQELVENGIRGLLENSLKSLCLSCGHQYVLLAKGSVPA